jgi:hypothetical protein
MTTAPHPRKGNKAVERKLHILVAHLLERQCLPQWRWAHITGCTPKGWPDFLITSPLRACFLQLPTSNGSVSKERSELAVFLISCGYGYGFTPDFDGAVAMLRDWGCIDG